MSVELYRVHRPTSLIDLIGQDDLVDTIEEHVENKTVPHCILASGPSGTGKTTLFRILRNVLECSDLDFKEINAADFRGIDTIRDIRQTLHLRPIKGSSKVWLVDEAHQLSSQAQEAILKMLEDTPSHVYFFLASTDPQKLKKTIITRSMHLQFKALSQQNVVDLVSLVYKKETSQKLPDVVAKAIYTLCDGSARKALVLLHQILHMDMSHEEDVIERLGNGTHERKAIEICRALLNSKTRWKEMATILKEVDEEPEQIRRMILGYMKNVALGGGGISGRACRIIDLFRDNFFDCGLPGLVACCYNAVSDSD